MTDGIEAITTRALTLALDAAALRHQAIAANIANAETVGYVQQEVSFEVQLDEARRSLAEGGRLDARALSGVQPRLEQVTAQDGAPPQIRLDEQVAALAQNAAGYQALVKGISRHLAVLSAAVSEGKR